MIRYVNSVGEIIRFDIPPYKMLSVTTLFNYAWGYETTSRGVHKLSKSLKSKDIKVVVSGKSISEFQKNAERLYELTEYDVVKNTPGKLYVGDYHIPCYILSSDKDEKYMNVTQSTVALTIVPDSKSWIKLMRREFIYSESQDETGRGYPYGYEYDYAAGSGNTNTLTNSHFDACDFVMKISGYAFEPSITIGEHVYKVNETIQENEILTIDSKEKSIMLTKNNGVQVNLFSKRDKSSYIFEKIPAGNSKVYWNSNFNFEITLSEERSEPKWT